MDRGKKACNGDRETCHKDHKSGFQRNIGNTAAQDPDLGKCKECYQQSVNTLGTRKKLKKQNLGKFVRIFRYNACLKARKRDLCIYGFLSVVLIYGGIMNPASILMSYGYITPASLVAFYISGIPVDLVHALSTVIFLWFLSRPLLEKLERIKKKYGLIESGKEEML